MDVPKVPPAPAVDQLAAVLDSPEIERLIQQIEFARWTGRPGYPVRAMVGMCLVKSLYRIDTWTRVCRLVGEHVALQQVLGATPSQWACYRFAKQLRERDGYALDRAIADVLAGLKAEHPDMGVNVAVDGSDMPAYANGHKPEGERDSHGYTDPDASWGHRSAISTRKRGGYFGYKLHCAVDTATDLPLAWSVRPAKDSEQKQALDLIDEARATGFEVRTMIADKGYDSGELQFWLMQRGISPVVALKETATVKRGAHETPRCEHGEWTFAGADPKRRATKWRCPTGICTPASTWLDATRLHPLIPRESKRFKKLYASRGAVEREFGRLKHDWGLLPLRIRGLRRVQLHADLTILARLACRLAQDRARAVPLAA